MRAEESTATNQKEDEKELQQKLVSYSALRSEFVIVLTLSTAIASFGLMADSSVAIVGAMLIAPLMKPILAYAFSIVTADWRLQLRAVLTLFAGTLITIFVAGLAEQTFGIRGPTEQIMSRTHPSLIDLGVAIAAGIAASLATIRRNVADTLPGVAIAVALVPPLCVAGIGFSQGAWSVAWGATLLYAVNLVAIVFTAANIFVFEGYGRLRRASHGLMLMILVAACALSIPLTKALKQLRIDDRAQEIVEAYLHEQYPINHVVHPDDLSQVDTIVFPDHIFVFIEIKASAEGFTEQTGRELQHRLAVEMDKPVNLKVQLLLSKEMEIFPHQPSDSDLPDYGSDVLVPRR